MPRTLVLAPSAQRDLEAARGWFTQSGAGVVAAGKLRALVKAIGELRSAPCSHTIDPLLQRRERSAVGYRIIYRVDPDTGDNRTAGDVVVLRIYGPGQHRS